jgi:DDE superfamily endonuclease
MLALSKTALPLLRSVAGACTLPTAKRFLSLMLGAILTTGRRTITNMLRAIRGLAPGHPSSYHHVFSRRRWSLWPLARGLAGLLLRRWAPAGTIGLAGDDTVDEHRGPNVYGKGRHRDPVRSTQSYTAYRWGHKWVVLSILVHFPFAKRPWALPVLVALYRSPAWSQQNQRRHKTPARLLRQLVAALLRWFPQRHFTLAGDGGFGSHEMAVFAHRHRRRLTLVSRFVPDARLYQPPPVAVGKRPAHRPRKKGERLPSPEAAVAATAAQDRGALNVSWYGGGRRDIEVVTGTGSWYRSGEDLVPLRWVFVHDRTGTHRDDYLLSTDVQMTSATLVETFTGRWSIETTFQEMRAYLGLETTRGWKEATVLRLAPCLFGLHSVVAVLYALLPKRSRAVARVEWPGKVETTFSDAITTVRRWLWVDWVFAHHGFGAAFSKLSPEFQETLLSALAPPA